MSNLGDTPSFAQWASAGTAVLHSRKFLDNDDSCAIYVYFSDITKNIEFKPTFLKSFLHLWLFLVKATFSRQDSIVTNAKSILPVFHTKSQEAQNKFVISTHHSKAKRRTLPSVIPR
jgi:hypothetical protein